MPDLRLHGGPQGRDDQARDRRGRGLPRTSHPRASRIRLASGNVGVQAAINEELERSELPMMLYVYAAIIALVLVTYRDWRATICCCVPLTVATSSATGS